MNLITKQVALGFVVLAALCFGATQRLEAYLIPPDFSACRSLEVCLQSLDSAASAADGSIGPDEKALARKLSGFGEPAKQELLRRASGEDAQWRSFSGAILANWKTWSPSDVPELRNALRMDPGGWMAGPLGKIGTPAAIEALVEDLPKGSGNQTDFALKELGPRAIPALMPLLEDENTYSAAMRMLKLMGDSAGSFQSSWCDIANDSRAPRTKRLAALRAMSALGWRGRPSAAVIETLSASPELQMRSQAALTLEAIRSFEQAVDSRATNVSMIELIANPLKFDRRVVRIIAFLRLEFEGDALYLHREDFEHGILTNSVFLDRPKDLSEKQVAEVDKRYVICEGTFIAGHGGMGMSSGSLTHITRLETWGREAP